MASPSSHPSPSPNTVTSENGATNTSDGHHVHGSRPSTPQYATFRTPMSTPDKEGDLNGIREFPAPHAEGKAGTWGEDNGTSHAAFQSWVPIPLRPWFWIPLVCVMIGGGIGLEVAFHFSEKNRGWETNGKSTTEQGFMHYVYTFPPAAIALLFAGFWAWTDIEIRRLQPYVDLARGNSPPQRSLLLDYTRSHTLYVWSIAAKNHHFLVTLSSLLALATFCFQPLSAALFNVQDVFWTAPRTSTNSLVAPGLNQNENFQDLTAFLTAAGYASANVLYNIGDPIFVDHQYTVAPFQLPDVDNGTITTNTTIIESKPNCVGPDGQVNMMQLNDGVWNNSASFSGCTFEWSVNRSAEHLFGANPVPTTPSTNCTQYNSIPLQFRPVVFWFFTYVPTPAASVTLCAPSITLHDATVSLSVPSNETAVKASSISPLGTLTSLQLVQFAGNVTGDPLDGRAYNGLFFPFADAGDPFVAGRQQAVQLALPGAVFQAAQQSPGGLGSAFQANAFAGLAESVYTTYLTLIARTVYFLPLASSPISLQADITTPHLRLFLSPVATHLLAALLFTLGIGGTLLQLAHRRERAVLHLASAPGTIASAVSMGLGRGAGNGGEGGSGDGGLGSVLAGRLGENEIRAALRDKRFRIDPVSMRIVVEGEAGYETAQSPRRMEFFQGKRFSLSHLLRRDGQ